MPTAESWLRAKHELPRGLAGYVPAAFIINKSLRFVARCLSASEFTQLHLSCDPSSSILTIRRFQTRPPSLVRVEPRHRPINQLVNLKALCLKAYSTSTSESTLRACTFRSNGIATGADA